MDIEAAKQLINSPVVQRYIEKIDSDAQVALDEMKATLGGMSNYPSSYISEYKADGAALERAWGTFNAEWNKIALGRARDGRAALDAYRRYVLTLCILEEQNVRFGAFVEAGVARFAAAFIAFLIDFLKRANEKFKALHDELQLLDGLLKKAKKEVTEAEWQRGINLVISGVSVCLPTVGLGVRVGVAVGTFTLQMVLDAALGPSNPGALGTINNAAGDAIGVPKKIKPGFAKLGSALSGALTLKLDSDEVEDARKILEALKDRMRRVEKTMKMLEPFLDTDGEKLEKMQVAFENAVARARSAQGRYRSAESQRLGLLRELQDLR